MGGGGGEVGASDTFNIRLLQTIPTFTHPLKVVSEEIP